MLGTPSVHDTRCAGSSNSSNTQGKIAQQRLFARFLLPFPLFSIATLYILVYLMLWETITLSRYYLNRSLLHGNCVLFLALSLLEGLAQSLLSLYGGPGQ